MKNLFVLFACLISLNLFAQNNPAYERAMTNALTQMEKAETTEDWQSVANTFSRIGGMTPTEWLPNYYAAFSNLQLTFIHASTDEDKAEKFLEAAQKQTKSALKIAPNESELIALDAYALIAEVSMSPMIKGPLLSSKVFSTLEKAIALNANNPRAHFLTAMYTLNMPEFFGGGAENARPHAEKAVEIYKGEVKGEDMLPKWGASSAESMLKKISLSK